MTRDEKIIRNKVGVLELAKQLGSVSQACRIMGFSRDSSIGSGTSTRRVARRR
jgi:molybdenum-dependent DNA-binding transcriptional regulator ModE